MVAQADDVLSLGTWRRDPGTVVRQAAPAADPAPAAIVAESEVLGVATEWAPHAHAAHELVWVRGGTLTSRVGRKIFTVPPGFGLWLPAGVVHGGRLTAGAELHDAFFPADRTPVDSAGPTLITMTSLLESLLAHLTAATDVRTNPVLRGDQLVLGYGKTAVVHGVSVELAPGQVTALIGPNGSGKSTLLRALARLHRVDGGTVLLGDRAVSLLNPREVAREVTLFSQSRQAPHGLTVSEVVAFGRNPHRRRFAGPSPADRDAIDRAMTRTGVREMSERPVGELSGGEMQRVWLAACLAQETGAVLLDEPTNHLDLRYQIETLDLVRDLADERGAAVGIVLHDLDHAARVADRLVLLHAGRIHAAGDPLEVLTAEHLSAVYDLRVEVGTDPRDGRLRIDPVGRHPARHRTTPGEKPA